MTDKRNCDQCGKKSPCYCFYSMGLSKTYLCAQCLKLGLEELEGGDHHA